MRRSTQTLIALHLAALGVWPAVAAAQPVDAAWQTPRQVHDQFVHAGLVVGEPTTWSMTGVTTFLITDASGRVEPSDRVVMVLVYPEMSLAEAHRQATEYPVLGYGRAEWRGNVALVQSTQRQLSQIFMDDQTGMLSIDDAGSAAYAQQRAELPRVDADLMAAMLGPASADL
jgi:hypothetical protein